MLFGANTVIPNFHIFLPRNKEHFQRNQNFFPAAIFAFTTIPVGKHTSLFLFSYLMQAGLSFCYLIIEFLLLKSYSSLIKQGKNPTFITNTKQRIERQTAEVELLMFAGKTNVIFCLH